MNSFFLTYSSSNNLISAISQVLITPRLIFCSAGHQRALTRLNER